MHHFRTLFSHFRSAPGMYLREVTYSAVVALILGYDLACDGGALVGFREWLVPQIGSGNNLSWDALALHLAFPSEPAPQQLLHESAANERHAIEVLLRLVGDFVDLRDSHCGLRKIFLDYENWLARQDWHNPNAPGWVGSPPGRSGIP